MKKYLGYLTAEEIKKDRDNKVRELLQDYKGESSLEIGIEIVEKYYLLLLKPKEKIKILECGVGSGYFAMDLRNHNYEEIYGLDICDFRNQEVLDKNIFKDFKTLDLSWEKIPWSDKYFDLITVWCVLPHLENPHNFIREVHRVLGGGICIVSMPHINSLRARKIFFKSGDLERYTENNNHISIFTPAIFKKTVLKYFDLIATEYYIAPGIYKGRFGSIKHFGIEKQWFGQKKFKHWFGTNIIYILRKL